MPEPRHRRTERFRWPLGRALSGCSLAHGHGVAAFAGALLRRPTVGSEPPAQPTPKAPHRPLGGTFGFRRDSLAGIRRRILGAVGRRADPEGIYLARRAAVLSILTTSGVPPERAEELVRAWEADAEGRGVPRLERTFWERAAEWTDARAWPNRGRREPEGGG
jgi:hypothetical protein